MPELKTHPQTYVSSTPILRVHYVELDMRSAPFDKKAGAPGGELRDRQADHHPEADGRARRAGRHGRCSRSPSASTPRCKPYPVRSQEGQGAPRPGRLSERRGHHAAQQRPSNSGRSLRGHRPDADRGRICARPPGCGTRVRPGTSSSRPRARPRNGYYGTWGNYSVFDADAVLHPLLPHRAGRLDRQVVHAGRRARQAHRRGPLHAGPGPSASGPTAQIQQIIREEAPAIFLWTQYDTLAISKKVQYAARGRRVALALRRQARSAVGRK